ncbi:hypothetical protein BU17DRAFT_68055 [Hysterangium stoloniferum]|nr:hypothetical protein BU17DRAFT_68055 [Hysterangium stoloniferum]
MIPECVRGLMFSTEGNVFINDVRFQPFCYLYGVFASDALGDGGGADPTTVAVTLYGHNCSLNANRNTNCTLNLNLNPTANDNGSIHHITIRQTSLPNPRSHNSTRNPDPDGSFCFPFPRLNRPKLSLLNKLRRRSRGQRKHDQSQHHPHQSPSGAIVRSIAPAPASMQSRVEVGGGAGAVDRCRVNGRMCRRNSRLGPRIKRKRKANWESKYNRKHTKLSMHKPKHGRTTFSV